MGKVLGWILLIVGWLVATTPGFDIPSIINEWITLGVSLVLLLLGGWQLQRQRVMAVMR